MHPLVRIAYVGFKRIDAGWSFTHRSSPFWRLYHDFDPGAAVEGPDGRFALDPAQVLLLPAGTVFSAVPPAQPVRHLYLHFTVDDPAHRLPTAPCTLAVDPLLRAQLGDGAAGSWTRDDSLRACALAYQVLARLPPRAGSAGEDDADRDLAVRHIRENLASPITVTQLARIVGVGVDHFIRRFARRHGTTPARYLANERLALARHLLATSDLALDEVARRCGYASRGHLATAVRRATGRTPGEMRRAAARGDE